MLQQWGEKAGAVAGCCPVTGTPPVVVSNQCWVCKPSALLSLFSLGGDISADWSLSVFSCCGLSPRCSARGHAAVSAPALGKVSVHPALLQHAGKQPGPLRLLLSRFALPALGQGCPMECSLPGPSRRQWPHSKGLRSVSVCPACSRHGSRVLCE